MLHQTLKRREQLPALGFRDSLHFWEINNFHEYRQTKSGFVNLVGENGRFQVIVRKLVD